jgi:hypothetical protein
VGRLS